MENAIIRGDKLLREKDIVVASRIDCKVEDAINKVMQYAIPYFLKIAVEHGNKIE